MPISLLPVLTVFIPLAAALAVALTGQKRANLREFWSVGAGLLMFLSSVLLLPEVLRGGTPELVIARVLPGVELAFRADPFGLLFVLGASLLWVLTSFYSIGYMRSLGEHDQTRYYACFALALAATAGAALAANLFTLFLMYEGLTLVTYPLVGHHGTQEARAGARKYVIYLLGAAKLLLVAALILTYNLAGTLEFRWGGVFTPRQVEEHSSLLFLIFLFFLLGFAKNAVMPLHSWLPAAMVAPTPVSALLHAVAVVKTGVFSTLRVFFFVFGPQAMREIGADQAAFLLASVTILAGALLAMAQDNLKARLAFSTVSQLSYIILGGALLNQSGILGGIAHIPNHAVSKITLFFCAGSIYVSTHKTEISQMGGLARRMPWTMAAFSLASLSVVGIPPTAGFVSKWLLALGSVQLPDLALLAVLLVGSLLSAAYLGPVVYQAYFGESAQMEGGSGEVPWVVVPLMVSALASLILGLYPVPILDLARKVMG